MQVWNVDGALVKAWMDGVPVEDEAKNQLLQTARLPFIFKHVAAMPDMHFGIGACVGSVIPTVGAVIPSAVGVDIGCGMATLKTKLTKSEFYEPYDIRVEIRHAIEKAVPHGRTNNGGFGDRGAWHNIPTYVQEIWDRELAEEYDRLWNKHLKSAHDNNVNHLGTLGTGNHFCELSTDLNGDMWIVLHSGSRGCGNKFGTYFINLAKQECKKWYVSLPNPDLAYFPEGTEYFEDYLAAATWAQKYAALNRAIMMSRVIDAVQEVLGRGIVDTNYADQVINCHHNYVARERHFGQNILVTRKGAIRAGHDELGIIPGSMGSKSYIVRGLGNQDSFFSSSHGAGRTMSRTQAKKTISLADHENALADVECAKGESTLDESPMAYKDIDAVMAAQSDLVEVVHTLKQIICVKGEENSSRRK